MARHSACPAALLLLALPGFLLSGPAAARMWTVLPDGTGDAPAIRAAVDSAASGDTISLGDGIFAGAGNREVHVQKAGLTILSAGGDPAACVIDCENEGRAFRIDVSGGTIRIEGVAVRNGLSENGGAIQFGASPWPEKRGAARSPSLYIRNCLFSENEAAGMGGAVFIGDEAVLEVEDSEFRNNTCREAGGAYAAGGAICFRVLGSSGACSFRRTLFAENRSDGPGGALYIVNAHVLLEDCEIAASRSGLNPVLMWPAGAGAMIRRFSADSPDMEVVVERCAFLDNRGTMYPPEFASDGGGLMVKGYDAAHPIDLRVSDTRFERNFSAQGGGLYVGRFCEGIVERCRFRENLAYLNGGGSYKGGALAECLGESVRFEFCEFLRNGAGFYEDGEPNRWIGNGGAFMTRLLPRAEFVNCSFSNNRTNDNGGRGSALFHWAETGAFTDSTQRCLLLNCVFYGDEPGDVQVRADSAGFTAVAGCAWEPGEFACEGVIPADTVLLAASPFLSEDSLRLREDSPCVDRGVPLGYAFDIEGWIVPQGNGTDIGAYEHPAESPTAIGGGKVPPLPAGTLSIRPNPFNPETSIAFTLDTPGPARLTVHDVAGRLVTVLADGVRGAGRHEVRWNGRGRSGRSVPSGVYLIRLDTGHNSLQKKTVRID